MFFEHSPRFFLFNIFIKKCRYFIGNGTKYGANISVFP